MRPRPERFPGRHRPAWQTWQVPSHLGVLLPGASYGPLGPALRFPSLVLEELGAKVVAVEYPPAPPGGQLPWEDLWRSVGSAVAYQLADARPARVTFVAKSLGTLALAGLAEAVVGGALVEAIWLTPLFGLERVRKGAIGHRWRSLLVAGGADGYHDPLYHEVVRDALGADSLVLAGGDHCLEVRGDVGATLDGFRALVEALAEFVSKGPCG
jgi:hypothetical protein